MVEETFTSNNLRKIAIISGKGGIGKSTLAINLGYILNKEFNFDTVIVDGNLTTPHLSVNLGLYNYGLTLNHVLKNKAKIEEAIFEHPSGIKVIPASLETEDLKNVNILRLSKKLDELKSNIIIDSAPGLGKEGIAAISSANEILFTTQPFSNAVIDIYRCKKIVEKLNKDILGIVVNGRKGRKHELTDREIERLTEIPIIETIPYDIEIEKSLTAKLPLPIYNPKAKSNKNFYSLASKITGIPLERKRNVIERLLDLFKK
jgi:MinD-like ATPase involved in chromosome partitioning or flagellar assembly